MGLSLRQIAGPFFAERITSEQILANYKTSKVKILIVPGHDNDSFGTQFNGTTEAQLNAELGQGLLNFSKMTTSLKLTSLAPKTAITTNGLVTILNQTKKK